MTRLLVVGAKPGSLGAAVVVAGEALRYGVYTAGISGEQIPIDLAPSGTSFDQIVSFLKSIQPDHIICTVGVNTAEEEGGAVDPFSWYRWHFDVNVVYPMRLLAAWLSAREDMGVVGVPGYQHYVAVSSNSAHLPRSRSAAYCASKAALSMALRVKARDLAPSGGPLVYGYEPGLLTGTPMTRAAERSFSGPLTRMKPRELHNGVDPGALAEFMVNNLEHHSVALSGCLLPYDADEL